MQSDEIPLIKQQWENLKSILEMRFSNRESGHVQQEMEQAIELFSRYLTFTNENWTGKGDTFGDFEIKPVNLEERLLFITSRPRLYHSFIQLKELFAEQEKQFAKYEALKMIKRKRPD